MNKKDIPIPGYLVLLPVFFVLHHNNELFGFIPIQQSLLAFGICIVGMTFVFGVSFLFTHSIANSALITFLFSLFILFFGSALDGLKSLLGETWITKYIVFIPFFTLAIVSIIFWIRKRPNVVQKVSSYLNILLVIFIVVELTTSLFKLLALRHTGNLNHSEKGILHSYQHPNIELRNKPDIFFVVFDGYTSNNVLQSVWNFDNSPFTNWLQSRQFYIVDSSKANYNFTPFSISSTLNMSYLDGERGTKGNDPTLILNAVSAMSNNETVRVLKSEGYQVRYFVPFDNKFDDIGLHQEFSNFPAKELYNQTLPMRIKRDVLWNFTYGKWRLPWNKKVSDYDLPSYNNFVQRAADVRKTIKKLEETCDTINNRQPQFVYAHFMITHQPHLFDSVGNLRPANELINQTNLFGTYIQQVKFANQVIMKIVEQIKLHNRKNTIIIIEGDHGFRGFKGSLTPLQFANLNVIYFPDRDYRMLYKKMSPINTFRIVLNHFFDQNFALLKDSTIEVNY